MILAFGLRATVARAFQTPCETMDAVLQEFETMGMGQHADWGSTFNAD